jgi:hypothetical protein
MTFIEKWRLRLFRMGMRVNYMSLRDTQNFYFNRSMKLSNTSRDFCPFPRISGTQTERNICTFTFMTSILIIQLYLGLQYILARSEDFASRLNLMELTAVRHYTELSEIL